MVDSPISVAQPVRRLLLRPVEAAEACGRSRSTIYKLMADGSLPSITLPGVRGRLIPVDALASVIAERMASGE